MKKPEVPAVLAAASASVSFVTPPTSSGNPHQKGDKVRTKLGGNSGEVKAEVTAVFKDEVQVRTPDG